MADQPLVAVITPTWGRHGLLFSRCLPTVAAQTYPSIEHVVVSDGPDPVLAQRIAAEYPQVVYAELPEHAAAPHWGNPARRRALEIATADLIAYLDDDDSYRPDHVQSLTEALLAAPGVGFAHSMMLSHAPASDSPIGGPDPYPGGIGTPMLLHHRHLLATATWDQDSSLEDWQLVSRWTGSGVRHIHVPKITADVWPSTYYG